MSIRAFLLTMTVAAFAFAAAPRRQAFNEDWRFIKGDPRGAEQPGFSDASWRKLDLPHDWAIESPFDEKINPHAGALPAFGVAWYRKTFTLNGDPKTDHVTVQFDGAMSNARVYINGHDLGDRPYGYISFVVELTPHLNFGGKPNVFAVRLSPEENSSRWYPGAGIYRNVWLDTTGPVHVAQWGTRVTTPSVTDQQASVAVQTELRNRTGEAVHATLLSIVLDAAGKEVARASTPADLAAGAWSKVDSAITVPKPHRWDIETPYLYRLVSEIQDGGRTLDRYETPFGIRTVEFNKTAGFLLNGRHVKMKGVCLHHDLGALGAAVNRRATERQLEIMRSMGANAIRTSHNPPSPELLEFADKLGFVVIDEAFDMWRIPKVKNGLSKFFDQWAETDLRDMIRRDRNHPSVVMWSIGNEIPEQGRTDGWKVARMLTGVAHDADATRPTTAAFDNFEGAIRNELAANVDIPGFNYKPMQYEKIMREHPNWVVYGAETSSCVSSRGVYHLPIEKYQKHPSLTLTSYDIISPPWAYLPDPEFEQQDKHPNLLGEFVWTGFDYLGEPTPYFLGREKTGSDWPARSSYFGIVDLAGFPKDRYYLYQSVWLKDPMVHLLPHWNWAGREGQPIPVMAYTNADEVELFVNGKSLGRKARFSEPVELPVGPNISEDKKYKSKYRLMWTVPYQPGSIRAVAYAGGKQVASKEIRTAGAPARVRLIPDRTALAADDADLSFVTVRVEDRNGNLCPMADNLVKFKVSGAGKIAAVDNGNSATIEPFQADYRKAFNGMALVIVRTEKGRAGSIRVSAASDGLAGDETSLRSR